MTKKVDLIVHPVRLRIVQHLQGHELTSGQLHELLSDVPQATLYRQIKILLDGGMLQVAEERVVHGIIERVYTMPRGSAHLSRDEFAQISAEDHQRYFSIMMAVLSGALKRYVSQSEYDIVREGMTYFQATPLLTDEEARQLRIDLLALAKGYGSKPPNAGRRRCMLGVALIPQAETESKTEGIK